VNSREITVDTYLSAWNEEDPALRCQQTSPARVPGLPGRQCLLPAGPNGAHHRGAVPQLLQHCLFLG
jgi:hypothetical protein